MVGTLISLVISIAAAGQRNLFDETVAAAAADNQQWSVVDFIGDTSPLSRAKTWACTMGDSAYFFGGETLPDEVVMGDFWRIDFATLELTEVVTADTALPSAREKMRIACDEPRNLVYLLGGKEIPDLFWVYDPQGNTWREVPADPVQGLTSETFGTDFIAMDTTHHIVFAGTSDGEFADFARFDKRTEQWLPRGYDSRLMVEDPGGIGVGDIAIMAGGVFTGSVLPARTYALNTSEGASPVWEDLVTDGIAGEEFKMGDMGGRLVALMGDPGGKGLLAATNGIALLNMSDPAPLHWSVVNRTGDPTEWVELVSEFMATAYKGRLAVFGGAVSRNSTVQVNYRLRIFNPAVCPKDCNGRGDCILGNCMGCRGHSGVACEIPDPEGTDMTPIIAGVCGGGSLFLFIIFVVSWKATAKSRAFRRLYNTNRVAEDMAEQIAAMELDSLDYMLELPNPTGVQRSFGSIIRTLKMYKMYLPDSVLQSVMQQQGSDEDDESEPSSEEGSAVVGAIGAKAMIRQDSGKKSSRGSTAAGSRMESRMGSAKRRAPTNVQAELGKKLAKRKISAARFTLIGFETFTLEHGLKDPQNVHTVVADFCDATHTIVTLRKGTVVETNLAAGSITAAWNFQLIRPTTAETAACDAAYEAGVSHPKSGLLVHSAATTHMGYAGNTGGSQFRVPVLIGPHARILDALTAISVARSVPTVTTQDKLTEIFVLAPVDVVKHVELRTRSGMCVESASKLGIRVVAITGKVDSKNEEWMYQLEAAETNASYGSKLLMVYEEEGAAAALKTYDEMEGELPAEVKEALCGFVETLREGSVTESRMAAFPH